MILLLPAALAGTLSGRVLDPDGAPVAGADVQAIDLALQGWQTTSAADGSWTMSIPAGRYRVRALAPDEVNLVDRFHPSTREWCDSPLLSLPEEGELAEVEVGLDAGAVLSGQLTAPDGGAPAGPLRIWAIGDSDEVSGLSRHGDADEQGRFSVLGLDAPEGGAGEWVIGVAGEGWPDQYFGEAYDSEEATRFEVGEAAQVEAGELVLRAGIEVRGQVIGPSGPLGGARVHVYAGHQVVSIDADADGNYLALGLPPGDVLPWTSAEGHALTYWPDQDRPSGYAATVEEGGSVEGVDLYPPLQSSLTFQITDEAGEPLPEIQCLLYNDDHTVGQGDRTDEQGLLTIDELHPGNYELYIWAGDEGYIDDWVTDEDGAVRIFSVGEAEEAETVSLALPRAARIAGLALDEERRPLGGVVISARRSSDGNNAAATSAADGSFELLGLAAGDWELSAQVLSACPGDPGYVPVYWRSSVDPDEIEPISLIDEQWEEGLLFVMPADDDHDLMGDRWEEEHGLDASRDDSAEDPDEDGVINLIEYREGTDPRDPAGARGCSCGKGSAALLLLPLAGLRRRRRS